MAFALIACLTAVLIVALLGWSAWRAHDRLILLAYRAAQGPEDEQPAARRALEAQLSRPGRRMLARWMGLLPR